ncbi:T9SS type A sorting domain-containing protein [bacterium]|nr:T9SS type A sorting domain-containing protein [bacterium]
MSNKALSAYIFLLIAAFNLHAKKTIGLLINSEESSKGYTLFSPNTNYVTYLIDNDGNLVHSWNSGYKPGLMAYLAPDGYLYRAIVVPGSPPVGSSGGGVEKLDWQSNVVWHYEIPGSHHDIEVMPSGNVLIIAMETIKRDQAIEAGANPDFLTGDLLSEYIVEVEPTGSSEGNIVWQWRLWDHLVQNYDPSKGNYGIVRDHPELIDINAQTFYQPDFIHLNSIDYNEELDQIALSSRTYSEIWVIDHGTTTAEAQGHSGGKRGKGGDLLYRWGNPQIYDSGTPEDQILFQQHDAQWIAEGVPGSGNMLVFNNGPERGFSSADEIATPVDSSGNYVLDGSRFGPDELYWSYSAPNPGDFFAPVISGAQRLPNGNTLICNGPLGKFFEVTPEGEVVWLYINPVNEYGPARQGDSIVNNVVFKIRRYPPDYPAFSGRDMTPKEPIELAGVTESVPESGASLYAPGIAKGFAAISYEIDFPGNVSIKLYNATGQLVKTLANENKTSGSYQIDVNETDFRGRSLESGVYFIKLETGKTSLTKRIVLVN